MQNVRCERFWHLQAWCAALESAPMHLHILGICGTFMGGLAALAREAGHRVTGCDAGVYPPMSDQLRALGIDLIEGFGADQLALAPDMFVVGNVVSRARLPDGTPKFPLLDALMAAGNIKTNEGLNSGIKRRQSADTLFEALPLFQRVNVQSIAPGKSMVGDDKCRGKPKTGRQRQASLGIDFDFKTSAKARLA